MNSKRKSISLGLPLALAGIGAVASLFINKKLHAPLGILFAGLSVLHGFQHRAKLKTDARNVICGNKNIGKRR
ncbi:MAG: hypothetical protein J6M62_04145 [Selenomonadaceae bacterium]|nr:hypothetical protein [Selenomonadaceae bacterium]